MTLSKLAWRFAPGAIDPGSSDYGWTLFDSIAPSSHMAVAFNVQELSGVVKFALDQNVILTEFAAT